jgi:hypothetical protein
MEVRESMRLTKQEALSLFSYLEIEYTSVLNDKMQILKENPDTVLLNEMKRMVLVIKIYDHYKSPKVRDTIQDITALFIRDFYRDENRRISIRELSFLIQFIFSFRNVRVKKEIPLLKHNTSFLSYFKHCYRELAQCVPTQVELQFD